ncbi:MAG: hypothetical protein AB7L17_03720 [Ilumatobacteraceae bacterium]
MATVATIWAMCMSGCGGDDDTADTIANVDTVADAANDEADQGAAGADADELALGDPCELVPASAVSEIVGAPMTSSLVNVGDGLPGATCSYTGDSGTVSLSLSPTGASFFDSYRDQAEANGGIEPVDGLGDEAFVYQDAEVAVRAGEAMIQLQVFTSGATATTGGVEIARLAVAAISG